MFERPIKKKIKDDIDKRADVVATKPLITKVTTNPKPSSSKHFLLDNSQEIIHLDGIRKSPPQIEQYINKEESTCKEEAIPEIGIPAGIGLDEFNERALPKTAETYQLENFEKNAMIIFNQYNLEGYGPRTGTKEDEEALRDTFSKIGFEIEKPHEDLTKVELFDALKKFSSKDFTDYGCVVIVILTHGERDGLLRAKECGQLYSEQDIINHFKSQKKPTLITKPVILIIQACRGKCYSKGVAVMQKTVIFKDHAEEFTPYYLPIEADMLIFHSSYAKKVSYRPSNGSWFIQAICKTINKLYRTHDLVSIFTEVNRAIAINKYYMEYNRSTGERDVNKQMPVITSTLTRKLYLRRFNDSADEIYANFELSQSDKPCACYFQHFDYMTTCLRESGGSASNALTKLGKVTQLDLYLRVPTGIQKPRTFYKEIRSFGHSANILGKYIMLDTVFSHIVKSNPRDIIAKNLLDLSKSGFEGKTERILVLISNYLEKHYISSEQYKYIHFYPNERDTDVELQATKGSVKNWRDWTPKYFVAGLGTIGTCMGSYLIYNLLKAK